RAGILNVISNESSTIRQSSAVFERSCEAQSTAWPRIGNQIKAAPVFSRSGFVKVHRVGRWSGWSIADLGLLRETPVEFWLSDVRFNHTAPGAVKCEGIADGILAETAERDADRLRKAPAPNGNSHPLIRRDAWEFLPVHPQTGRISSTCFSDF